MTGTNNDGQLFQLSTMSSLLDGVFEGAMTYDEIKQYGDFGIGTFEHLDGELIAFDGEFYRLRGDGTATPLKSEDRTPFCSLTDFHPAIEKTFDKPLDKSSFEHEMKKLMKSENLFYAFRLDGVFKEVITRTVAYQDKPVPMTEAVKTQPVFHFKGVTGTIVGFWSPAFMQGIAVSGFHLHFIDKARKGGGHVLDYTLDHGDLQVDQKTHMSLYTPETAGFLHANLSRKDLEKEIKITEG
ncbi:acetolactate decarboxylase [Sporolactobacillus sp. CPB3-1]|uniref:Alpha-acetolactate decarboxylase n=1 Tax=Sporolactobacillus mangiferae TaxID=2940498 RepID=A0ABT0M8F6_9BACL|nr:acetolactate decarboxylase [Sporolactobacillus mangiferae]MCL1631157.1 acetolactate decarboxylase [Sporolactobacillus mangiferae]